jgi:ADP-ribose pyrophosphatase YjhB (NUDIX family)
MNKQAVACDNTSVGVIARDYQDKILLVVSKRYPYGWAPPSGHCDGHSYGTAAFREFEGETGLIIIGAPRPVTLFKSRKYFKCWRGGEYHDWQIFEVNWKGELELSQDETKDACWFTVEEICELANSGLLEPVWCEFFKELKII